MKSTTFRARRWIAAWLQAALMVGLPFLRVGGESALRFDVPSLRLYFFGSVIWISEAYFFLLALLLFFVGVMLFTVLYGRIWCGWMCPQTVLSDFSNAMTKISIRIADRPALRALFSQAFISSFSVFASATLIWYFVSPYAMFRDIAAGALGPWTLCSWIFFSALMYADLTLVRQKFCGTVCPYARLQSAFFDHRTLTIAFDTSRAEECRNCEACVRDCPAGVDIRNGLQVECINCAQCIDACSRQMGRLNKKPLVRYFFESGGEEAGKRRRPRVVGLSIAFAVIAALFAYQVLMRVPVDFAVLYSEDQPYHQTGFKDTIMNAYDLYVENRSLDPGEYSLTVSGVKEAEVVITDNPFTMPENTAMHERIYVFIKRQYLTFRVTELRFVLQSARSPEIRITRTAPFIYPERTDKGIEI